MLLSESDRVRKKTVAKSFFLIMLTEIFIGGAGRVFAFGSITLRMIFFVSAIIYTAILLTSYVKFNSLAIKLTLVFIPVTLLGILVGMINHTDPSNLVENVLMHSFFFTFPFFSQFIKTEHDVDRIIKIFKRSALFLAVIYLLFLVALITKLIPFAIAYKVLTNPEIAFRGDSALFYKGFLFMCCGVFFYGIGKNTISKYLGWLIILAAVIATLVRGFVVSLVGCYVFYLSFIKNIIWGLIFIAAIFIAFPFVLNYYKTALGDRSSSDQIRIVQIQQVAERTTPMSFIIGTGYGAGVPVRSNHFEINYLELFYKQGIIGLMFWFGLLAIVVYKFYKAKRVGNGKKGVPFLLSCLFLYIQSASNPFLTNSMGMTILFISILSLDVLSVNIKKVYV